jgi:hypothetical protein
MADVMPDKKPDRQMDFSYWFTFGLIRTRRSVMDESDGGCRNAGATVRLNHRLDGASKTELFSNHAVRRSSPGSCLRWEDQQLARAGECSKIPARVSKVRTDTCMIMWVIGAIAAFGGAGLSELTRRLLARVGGNKNVE